MDNTFPVERTLAYQTAVLIDNDMLDKISGGAIKSTTVYTTKQTFDNMGNYDVGADVQWDS